MRALTLFFLFDRLYVVIEFTVFSYANNSTTYKERTDSSKEEG